MRQRCSRLNEEICKLHSNNAELIKKYDDVESKVSVERKVIAEQEQVIMDMDLHNVTLYPFLTEHGVKPLDVLLNDAEAALANLKQHWTKHDLTKVEAEDELEEAHRLCELVSSGMLSWKNQPSVETRMNKLAALVKCARSQLQEWQITAKGILEMLNRMSAELVSVQSSSDHLMALMIQLKTVVISWPR